MYPCSKYSIEYPQLAIVILLQPLRDELGLDETKEKTVATIDSGYFSAENIQEEGEGIELLIASGREDKESVESSEEDQKEGEASKKVYPLKRFEYVKETDSWRCPDGRLLVLKETLMTKGEPSLWRYICKSCEGCSSRAHCLKHGEERRILVVKEKQLIRAEMRARLKKPEKQAIYRKRKWVAEQVIGQIKDGLGFRGVTMRGEEYARGQWLFTCAVHNVMKAVRFISSIRKGETVPAAAC